MSDTRLILSGAGGVKRGPRRGREGNRAGGGVSTVLGVVLLSLLHSLFLCSFLSLPSHLLLHHSTRSHRKKERQQGSSVIGDSRERDPFTSKRLYYDRLLVRPQPQ